MTNFYPKLLVSALVAFTCGMTAQAGDADFSANGIYYNILSEEDKTVEVTWPDETFFDPDPVYTGAITVPASVSHGGKEYTVAAIGKVAFGDATCSSITLPSTIKSIGKYGFSGATIKNITLPESLEAIGECAFFECDNLESMVIPNSVTTIDEWAFEECKNMETLVIGNGITTIPSTCFARCSALKEVVVPEGVKTIGYMAFAYLTNVETLTLPSTLETIDGYAFGYCEHLPAIEIPESVTSIGNGVFSACTALENITLPQSITVYPGFLFGYCAEFKEFEIPDHVTEIGPEVFDHCLSLSKVSIGSGVAKIGDIAFRSCPLTNVTLRAEEPPTIDATHNVFDANVYSTAQLLVPKGCVDKYKEAEGWKKFQNIVDETSSISSITSERNLSEIYDLNGNRLEESEAHGMVIIRQGSKTYKVMR